MARKKKPPKEGGNQNKSESRNYTSTSQYKQRVVKRFPVLSLYAPLFPKDAPDGGIHDVNDLVNYQRRKAEGGGDD